MSSIGGGVVRLWGGEAPGSLFSRQQYEPRLVPTARRAFFVSPDSCLLTPGLRPGHVEPGRGGLYDAAAGGVAQLDGDGVHARRRRRRERVEHVEVVDRGAGVE